MLILLSFNKDDDVVVHKNLLVRYDKLVMFICYMKYTTATSTIFHPLNSPKRS